MKKVIIGIMSCLLVLLTGSLQVYAVTLDDTITDGVDILQEAYPDEYGTQEFNEEEFMAEFLGEEYSGDFSDAEIAELEALEEALEEDVLEEVEEPLELGKRIIRINDFEHDSIIINNSKRPSYEELCERFPAEMSVVIAEGKKTYSEYIRVSSWYCVGDDYESSKGYYFQFNPIWDEGEYPLSSKLDVDDDVPYISVTVKNDKNKKSNIDYELISWATAYDESSMEEDKEMVFSYLVSEMGLSNAAACGVMANIQYESSFCNTAIGDGGTSYGLCQWHAERFTRLRKYCGARGMDYRTTQAQLKYLDYELNKSYTGVLAYLQKVENTKEGAYRAAFYWCVNFEMPAEMNRKGVTRGHLAKKTLWPIYQNRFVVYDINYELWNGQNDIANPMAYSNLTNTIKLLPAYMDGYSFEG